MSAILGPSGERAEHGGEPRQRVRHRPPRYPPRETGDDVAAEGRRGVDEGFPVGDGLRARQRIAVDADCGHATGRFMSGDGMGVERAPYRRRQSRHVEVADAGPEADLKRLEPVGQKLADDRGRAVVCGNHRADADVVMSNHGADRRAACRGGLVPVMTSRSSGTKDRPPG